MLFRSGLPGLLQAARAAGAVTSVDPGYAPAGQWLDGVPDLLRHVDFFLPNETEAAALTGCADPASAAAALARSGPTAVVTCGALGVLVAGPDDSFALRARAVRPVDTTGAGDNFDAGFLAALVSGAGLREAAAVGMACGAVALTGYGGIGRTATAGKAADLALQLLGDPSGYPDWAGTEPPAGGAR